MSDNYLLWIIIVVTSEYLLSLLVVYYLRRRAALRLRNDIDNNVISNADDFNVEFFEPTFEDTFYSFPPREPFSMIAATDLDERRWRKEAFMNKVLLFTRTASLCYLLSISCIWLYVRTEGKAYYFFTVWNVDLLCVYFLLATYCSLRGMYVYIIM